MPEGKRPLGRPRRRWVDNIRMDLVEVRLGDVDWSSLAQGRDKWRSLVNVVRIFKSRRMRWAGNVARMGEKRNAYRLLVGKPDGKRPLGRPRRRWVNNIKMDLLETGWGGVNWIGLAQDGDKWRALVNAVMNLRVP
jgi:hypothetical protein